MNATRACTNSQLDAQAYIALSIHFVTAVVVVSSTMLFSSHYTPWRKEHYYARFIAWVYVCVYTYICMHVCMCVCVCMRACMYEGMYACTCVCKLSTSVPAAPVLGRRQV
jgi:hypothetical protein